VGAITVFLGGIGSLGLARGVVQEVELQLIKHKIVSCQAWGLPPSDMVSCAQDAIFLQWHFTHSRETAPCLGTDLVSRRQCGDFLRWHFTHRKSPSLSPAHPKKQSLHSGTSHTIERASSGKNMRKILSQIHTIIIRADCSAITWQAMLALAASSRATLAYAPRAQGCRGHTRVSKPNTHLAQCDCARSLTGLRVRGPSSPSSNPRFPSCQYLSYFKH